MKSKVLEAVYQTVKDLHKAKIMSAATMRKFERLCFSSLHELNPEKSNTHYKDEENGNNPV